MFVFGEGLEEVFGDYVKTTAAGDGHFFEVVDVEAAC